MVITEPAKKTKTLCALMTVAAYAIMIKAGCPELLAFMEAHSLPDGTFWLVAALLIQRGPSTYAALLGDYAANCGHRACRD